MKKNNIFFLALTLAISSVGILGLLKPGFFLTDDGNSMIIRLSAFYENFRDGQFPVRFLTRLNYSYGYPVADFLYPLFMYIGVLIHAIGFSFINTIKIIFGLSLLSGALFSYLWLKKLFEEKSAFVGSVAYSLFPYHLFDIYKRGSVGEVLALGIIPFIFWSIEKQNILLTSIGYALLITAHNSLAIIFIPIIFLYQTIFKNLKSSIFSLAFGLGISSFFWIPALYDRQFTIFDSVQVSNYKEYFVGSQDIIIFGIIFFLSLIFGILCLLTKNKRLIFFLTISLLSLFLSVSLSSFLWEIFPLQAFVQFPFRFASLAILSTSFLLSFAIFKYKGKVKMLFVVFLLSIIFLSSRFYLVPRVVQDLPDSFYSTNQDTTTVRNEYMPKHVSEIPNSMPNSKIEILKGNAKIVSESKYKFILEAEDKSVIAINIIYFPGWEVLVDGKSQKLSFNNKYGIMHFEIDEGRHIVEVRFKETNIRLFADFISIISLILLFVVIKKNVKFY